MRLALIADLHGNLPALEAVAAHIQTQRIDKIYCLGDLVGKGPRSAETLDWARANCDLVLQGNWDECIWAGKYMDNATLDWYRKQLGKERLAYLQGLPLEHRMMFAGRRVRLLHGRPIVPWALGSDDPVEQRMQLFDTPDGYAPEMVGFADVHRPFYQHMRGGVLFNTGSVGNPLAGQPWASYVILEGEMGDAHGPVTHTIVQLPYDREEAVRQAEEAEGLPLQTAFVNEIKTGRYSR